MSNTFARDKMFFKYFFILINKFGPQFKPKMAVLFFFFIIGGFLELLGIAMIFPVMLILTSSKSPSKEKVLNICSILFPNLSDVQIACLLLAIMVIIFVLKNVFMMFLIRKQNEFAKNWGDWFCQKTTETLLKAPYEISRKINYGEKINLILSTRLISFNFMLRCIILFANGVVAFFILGLLFYKYPIPAVLSSSFIILFTYFENSFFKKKARYFGEMGVKLVSELNSDVNFAVLSQKEILISNKQDFFISYLNNSAKRVSDNEAKKDSFGNYPVYVTEIGIIFTFLIMCAALIFFDSSSRAEFLSSLAIIALIILRLVPQLNKILISMYAINVSKQSVFWFLDIYDKISGFEYKNQNTDEIIPFENTITLKNISYFYDNGRGIKDINLTVKKGEFIGIIGQSGSGKTTLADIISGINAVKSGDFTVDNKKIDKDNIVSWRKNISFLTQEPVFMKGTVAKNVAFGEENFDLEKVQKALCTAGLDIDYNTDTNELSVGQKHRVALARACYRNFEVLILDEATSSLDIETEEKVVQNILKLKGDKTIIAIAHRLSTLKECDRVIYVNDGTIKDIGTFSELRAKNPEVEKMLKISSFD